MFYTKPENAEELVTEEVMFDVTRDGEVVALDENEDVEQDQDQDQDPEPAPDEPDENPDPINLAEDESEEDGEGNGNGNNVMEAAANAPAVAAPVTTSSGCQVNPPKWIDDYKMGMTVAEVSYYNAMKEIDGDVSGEMGLVSAGLVEGISNMNELKILSFNEAMAQPDRKDWQKSVDDEHQRMKDNGVFQAVPREQVPDNADVIDLTWSMKKRANGVYRARLAGRGFRQRPGVSYDPKNTFAPVVHKTTIKVAIVLLVMASWIATVVDVKGAFLKAPFDPKHKVYMQVPKGFKKFYPKNCVLLLLKTLYGVKNAAKAFWLVILKLMDYLGFKCNKADPCLYYKWTK